jgi:5-methylcytosine-specific restriction endonuclease McrA
MATNTERACTSCGKEFKGTYRKCYPCRAATDRVCACGAEFKGTSPKCPSCRTPQRVCACGKEYRSTSLKCFRCLATERECTSCGKEFKGTYQKCASCRTPWRTCACGKRFKASRKRCPGCVWADLPVTVRRALWIARNNQRRARKKAAEVVGPVPASVYSAIRAESACVYCGSDQVAHVDHIVPLSRGGQEHEDNLVPACQSCNNSKYNKLLDEWDLERVLYAVQVSTKVASVYAEQFHHEGVTDVD